jgi:hypothetical protein
MKRLTANVRQKEEIMKIGYVRVSKQEQHEALQIDALKEAGCEKWFLDKMTGSKAERKGLDEALAYLRPGDTLVAWKLDRAGRSLAHLIELLKGLKERGIEFISLTERLPGLVSSYGRMTTRLIALVPFLGLVAGGQMGTRLAARTGITTTPSTLLRHLMQLPSPAIRAVRVLGVDDFAWKKRFTYGTILVDLERRKIIDVLGLSRKRDRRNLASEASRD